MPITATSDISYRTAGYIAKELLKRASPLMIVSKFGQPKPIPKNASKTIDFRGYMHLPNQPKVLTEGVTPASSKPTYRQVTAMLDQYGDWIEITDVLADTHEDPLIPEFTDILGQQSAIMLERVITANLMSGTNVLFSGATSGGVQATARAGVNQPLTLTIQRRALRTLKRQDAQQITSVIAATPGFNTTPIPPCFVAVGHTDLEADIRNLPGFVPTEKYSSYKPMEGEIGSVEGVRYLLTNLMDPWRDAGAAALAAGPKTESTTGTVSDVYPILFLAKDAFGVTPFAKARQGGSPVAPMVLNPNVARGNDPLGQRGSIGWKAYMASEILYDFYMVRAEVAVTKL